MLQITIPATESFNNKNNTFIYTEEQVLQLEHSLVSLSKWESKWCKPFLSKERKTPEETIDYIRCMTLTQNVDPMIYLNLSDENIRQVNDYIEAPMTATWFREGNKTGSSNEVVTAEIMYYWMIALDIPMECENWHLNKLLTLVRVCNEKNKPQKQMSKKELMSRNRALNEARKKQLNTKG